MPKLSSTKARLLLAGSAVVIGGVAFAGVELSSAAHAGTISVGQLDQVATSFAASMGDPNPTAISSVSTNRQTANQVASGAVIPSTGPSYLIVERGKFVDKVDSRPTAAASPLTGSVLTIIVDQQTGQVTDYGVSDNVPSLANLGPVTALAP